jgi:PAS domain-containing protein
MKIPRQLPPATFVWANLWPLRLCPVKHQEDANWRHSSRDQLQEKKSELLGSVFGNMLEGVVAVGRDETVLVANAASGRMLGFSAESAAGRVLLELTRSRPLHDAIQQAFRTGRSVNQEIESPGSTRRLLAIRTGPSGRLILAKGSWSSSMT